MTGTEHLDDVGHLLQALPPELGGVPTVVGAVPKVLEDAEYEFAYLRAGPGRVLVVLDDLARMLVTADRVTLEPAPGVPLEEVAYLVYGWAPRLVLTLQGRSALHASAVVLHGSSTPSAVAVAGHSRAGKSTTVLGLVERGHRLLVDDLLPLSLRDGQVWAHGWQRPLHLLDDAAERLGHDTATAERLERADRKVVVRPGPGAAGVESVPLRLLVHLEPDPDAAVPELRRLGGLDRVSKLLRVMDGPRIVTAVGRRETAVTRITELAVAIPAASMRRPVDRWCLPEVLDLIEDAAGDGDGLAE